MTLDADQIVDRRRLRRKLMGWRAIGVIAIAVAVLALIAALFGPSAFRGPGGPQIARISIDGFMGEDRAELEMIDRIARSADVRAVIVAVDSGGGASAAGEALYTALRKLAEAKPTVATLGGVGASAAYMAAVATDHIVARRSTITGSIGVIYQSPELSGLLAKLGIDVVEIKSAPLKSEPSLFEPPSEEAKAMIAAVVNDTYQWFVDIVSERRKLPRETVLQLADGRIVTGGQALQLKLVDAVGGEDTALDWLASERGVDRDLPVRDWAPQRDFAPFSFRSLAFGWVARQLGLAPEAPAVLDAVLPERLQLDGLLSVWHGSLSEIKGEGAAR